MQTEQTRTTISINKDNLDIFIGFKIEYQAKYKKEISNDDFFNELLEVYKAYWSVVK